MKQKAFFIIFKKLSMKQITQILKVRLELFYDRGPYHIESSLLICSANQWTGFFHMIGTSITKELKQVCSQSFLVSSIHWAKENAERLQMQLVFKIKPRPGRHSALLPPIDARQKHNGSYGNTFVFWHRKCFQGMQMLIFCIPSELGY